MVVKTLVSTITITASTASTVPSAAAGIVSMTIPVGLPEYSIIAVIAFVIVLSVKQIVYLSEKWNQSLDCSLDMTIIPLFVAFVTILMFKVSEIL